MSSLQQRIAQKQLEVIRTKQDVQLRRTGLASATRSAVTSPNLVVGSFVTGVAIALLRCRRRERRRHVVPKDYGTQKSLQWLIRHLGPPIIMALFQRAMTAYDE
ncbi:hypothetical protein CAI21_07680 [Alkalilimnicola ehrlichii]|uniref:Transmembrane protein n=1 Tax=Alkalilimnicola ehrlichii TaxID=351052 RepID=A0A3E0WWP4_9GAMM|nr:hypothetical protein [Alkalilimnicola ehrlichii]RFA30076.1 hypothetical protein CAI21_07680 [Alkalilimnicola ehrlichii]RFA37420.1 hypothetical protein CAL65_09020 [Alkalilimnicola ehrlichii]